MKTVLFQGDSITDVARDRENENGWNTFGCGYPLMVSAELGLKYPAEFKFYNRGISGDRITDLYSRIKIDITNLKPDYLSILIGVNDVWHEFARQNGVSAEKYEKIYDMLISEIKETLPEIKIMIFEPFTLKDTGNDEYYDEFRKEVELRAAAAKRIADKHSLTFIPLQAELDKMAEETGNSYWLFDGVHPRPQFHKYIADKWIENFEKIRK